MRSLQAKEQNRVEESTGTRVDRSTTSIQNIVDAAVDQSLE